MVMKIVPIRAKSRLGFFIFLELRSVTTFVMNSLIISLPGFLKYACVYYSYICVINGKINIVGDYSNLTYRDCVQCYRSSTLM
jgi:hypothetical protein